MSSESSIVPTTSEEITVVGSSGAELTGKDVVEALITQIEFYLSDSNLPFDKFLFTIWAQSHQSPSPVVLATSAPEGTDAATFHQGWIPLSRLTSFKRMQPYLEPAPAGFGSIEAIAQILLESKSGLVQLHKFGTEGEEEAGWYVKRLTELARPDSMASSVYVKGFPCKTVDGTTEEEKKAIKDEEAELQKKLELWAKGLMGTKFKSLRMRRADRPAEAGSTAYPAKGRGLFKGSVFIELDTADAVTRFMTLDPKPTWEGAELAIMSKAAYVEMKRQLYAPDSKAPAPSTAIPKSPYVKSSKPFNAWAESLISQTGVPKAPTVGRAPEDKKRKANPDGDEDREVLYDGVRFTARRTGGVISVVDEATVSAGWPIGKVLRMVIGVKAGSTAEKEEGEDFNFGKLKAELIPIAKPAFVSILPESRPIANLPSTSAAPSGAMVVEPSTDFPERLTAPPTIGAAVDAPAPVVKASSYPYGGQEYPARGQVSFKDLLSDESLEKLRSDVGTFEGRPITWVRATEEQEREHIVSRARYHAEQAFDAGGSSGARGGKGGRGGGRGGGGSGRGGGGRGGRGGRGGGRGGGGRGGGGDRAKRPRTD